MGSTVIRGTVSEGGLDKGETAEIIEPRIGREGFVVTWIGNTAEFPCLS